MTAIILNWSKEVDSNYYYVWGDNSGYSPSCLDADNNQRENFESIYDLIEKNDKVLSQKELALSRIRYALHPDYLFLMSKYLILDKRYYQSIDALLGSLKLDKDEFFLVKNNFEASKEELITKMLLNKLQ